MKTMSKFAFVCALAVSSVGFAADGQWEVFTGGLGSVDLNLTTGASPSTAINIFSGNGAFNLQPTIGYHMGNGLELLLSPGFYSASGGTATTTTVLSLMAGAAFNFMGNTDEAMYLKAQVGYKSITAGTTNGAFMWQAGLGKRFKLIDHVTWAPEVSFNMQHFTTSQTFLNIVPFQFTLLL